MAEYNAAVGPGGVRPVRLRRQEHARAHAAEVELGLSARLAAVRAYPLTCAITFTFGGIRTDSSARVVRPAGTPIPGLYAAGEVTGVYYNEYPAGTSVLRSVTFGRLAGAHAAGEAG